MVEKDLWTGALMVGAVQKLKTRKRKTVEKVNGPKVQHTALNEDLTMRANNAEQIRK